MAALHCLYATLLRPATRHLQAAARELSGLPGRLGRVQRIAAVRPGALGRLVLRCPDIGSDSKSAPTESVELVPASSTAAVPALEVEKLATPHARIDNPDASIATVEPGVEAAARFRGRSARARWLGAGIAVVLLGHGPGLLRQVRRRADAHRCAAWVGGQSGRSGADDRCSSSPKAV